MQFESKKLNMLEKEVIKKRLNWIKENQHQFRRSDATPRAAYELFLLNYLKLEFEDVRVIKETDQEIIWESRNFCHTLESCNELNLDTKEICRKVYEKPTQVFISAIDPSLRFYRFYNKIRPESDHCKEMIYKLDFEKMMRLAIEEAVSSYNQGNKGYGSVVVYADKIIGKAHDTAMTNNNPMQHAEVNAIAQACENLGTANLCGAILFSTCEPCPMCASLAIWSNLTTIVYGASIKDTAKLGLSRIMISNKEIADKAPNYLEIVSGILRNECLNLYENIAKNHKKVNYAIQ